MRAVAAGGASRALGSSEQVGVGRASGPEVVIAASLKPVPGRRAAWIRWRTLHRVTGVFCAVDKRLTGIGLPCAGQEVVQNAPVGPAASREPPRRVTGSRPVSTRCGSVTKVGTSKMLSTRPGWQDAWH